MGFLSNLFSKSPDYPDLDPASSAASQVAAVEGQLDELAGRVKDRIEVIPSDGTAYVFLGKPPKKMGLAWIHEGEISGLNELVKEHGLTQAQIGRIMAELGSAYERSVSADRFTATAHGRPIVVTPSEQLESEVHEIIDRIVH